MVDSTMPPGTLHIGAFMENIRTFRFTLLGLLLGLVVVSCAFFLDIETFETIVEFLHTMEHWEADELIIMLLLMFFGAVVDLNRLKNERERQIVLKDQRLHTLKATMGTVHDIVNNFLHSLSLFRMDAEDSGALEPESLELLDELIHDSAEKLKTLGDLKEVELEDTGTGRFRIRT